MIKKIGADRAQLIFNELKNSKVKNPGKLFIWKSNPKNFINQNNLMTVVIDYFLLIGFSFAVASGLFLGFKAIKLI